MRPCEKYRYDEQVELRNVLDDINDNVVVIDCAVCDSPKRCTLACKKAHSAKNACEYCENCAVTCIDYNKKARAVIEKKYQDMESNLTLQLAQLEANQDTENEENEETNNFRQKLLSLNEQKENELKKAGRKQLTWPSSTMTGNLRTLEGIEEIVSEIERDPNIVKNNPDFCKGIKGRSHLLQQPHYNLITDTTVEYMHSFCIGVVKRLVSLTFTVGENRDRVTKRKLSKPKLYNDQVKKIQVHREISRRCRNLDFGVMRAAEFRNISLFFFPVVLNCIEDEYRKKKKCGSIYHT